MISKFKEWKITIFSDTFDIWIKLEVILRIKLSGQTDTSTEASNLIDDFYKNEERENEQQYWNALDKFYANLLEISNMFLEQTTFKTSSKIEEHVLVVMDESTREEKISELLQTNNKQLIIAVNFLTGYNGAPNVTNENNNLYFATSVCWWRWFHPNDYSSRKNNS